MNEIIRLRHVAVTHLPAIALTLAAGVLAFHPVQWLVQTWREPAYDSSGGWVFVLFATLLAWSLSSATVRRRHARHRRKIAWALLAGSALARLAGQLLAINTVGAVCLVVDVLAVGLLLGLDNRARPVSPFWLAVVFAFSLPLERILQRTIGFGLQHLSADGACLALKGLFGDVTCQGVRLVVSGTDVLVDLPCSGARAVLLLLLAFAVAATVCRPSIRACVAGGLIVLASAVAANVLRIVVLAVGLAKPAMVGGIDVMAAPWHDAIGLVALALGASPLLVWAGRVYRAPSNTCPLLRVPPAPLPARVVSDGWWLDPHPSCRPAAIVVALGALLVACVIVNLPGRAFDVARREKPIVLPLILDGRFGQPLALTDRERAFFTRFGGSAAKASYGSNALMVVRTTSPLRHLHTPDECLRGIGFAVAYRGMVFDPLPTAVYVATAPDGARYRIDVSFFSDRGEVTTNVAEAVWRWMEGRARAWTAIQRIVPLSTGEPERRAFTRAVAAALDLPVSPQSVIAQGE